jgi:hypothetical protein
LTFLTQKIAQKTGNQFFICFFRSARLGGARPSDHSSPGADAARQDVKVICDNQDRAKARSRL